MGISPARVQQIERRAILKLRAAFKKLGIESSLPPESSLQ